MKFTKILKIVQPKSRTYMHVYKWP